MHKRHTREITMKTVWESTHHYGEIKQIVTVGNNNNNNNNIKNYRTTQHKSYFISFYFISEMKYLVLPFSFDWNNTKIIWIKKVKNNQNWKSIVCKLLNKYM